ncbi:cytochrome P450 [Actinoplanes campanulatus]|uniref:Cytochrome P450 n=1 Tax=Actinoplanes campanulatus TaxID=113559 RepID=A0A7W5AM38_9ACTN|nr:cytochrome P450 [Actinoplanes campanulatus]MBB3098773.1 cytochrome P450 [Actinoplanes campanulatus]GGN37103.1 cytochrome P450 hydroxylase [Actinoplanes campanulatus]GID40724.1 cytochrome P450 hydroxylase [Actinoplanes campanulatus]
MIDFTDSAFQNDPHPTYARMRRTGPVRRVRLPSGLDAWLVTRYEDARRVLADPRLSKSVAALGSAAGQSAAGGALSRHMLAVDPPDHTRLRRLVSAAFTVRRIEALRPRIEVIATELLDALDGRDRADLIDAFAFPLPIQVICELLGVPAADQGSFRAWSNVIVAGAMSGDRLGPAIESMIGYIRTLLAERREHGGDDLLTGLIQVRDSGDGLTEEELTSMVFLLLLAGHETTVNLIGNGAYLLLRDRERWERLRADRALLPSAIEEFLRYEGPVETSTFRVATEDLEIGGEKVAAGDPIVVVLLSANRDDDRFPGADELRLDRPQNPHLAFGHGIHYCLGAPLARLEAQIAFTALLDRFPDLRLAVEPEELIWRPGTLLRGLTELPVRL